MLLSENVKRRGAYLLKLQSSVWYILLQLDPQESVYGTVNHYSGTSSQV